MASSADDVEWPYWIGLHDGLQERLTGLVSSLVHPIHSRCELFRCSASHTTPPPIYHHKSAFVLVVERSSYQRGVQDGPMEPPPAGGQTRPGRNRRRCHHDLLLFAGRAAGGGGGHVRAGTHPKGHQPNRSWLATLPVVDYSLLGLTNSRCRTRWRYCGQARPSIGWYVCYLRPPYVVVGRVRMMLLRRKAATLAPLHTTHGTRHLRSSLSSGRSTES